jgi:ABC-type multidrug transport system fused ATPase/permease subunit
MISNRGLEIWLEITTTSNEFSLGLFIGVYALFALLTFTGISMMLWSVMILIAPRTAAIFHKILLNATLRAPIWLFEKMDTSKLLNRFSQDMSIIELPLPIACFMLLLS